MKKILLVFAMLVIFSMSSCDFGGGQSSSPTYVGMESKKEGDTVFLDDGHDLLEVKIVVKNDRKNKILWVRDQYGDYVELRQAYKYDAFKK